MGRGDGKADRECEGRGKRAFTPFVKRSDKDNRGREGWGRIGRQERKGRAKGKEKEGEGKDRKGNMRESRTVREREGDVDG